MPSNPSDQEVILVRADGSPEIGTGHVMRCLALSQAWPKENGRIYSASIATTNSLEERLRSEGIITRKIEAAIGSKEDAQQTIMLAKEIGATWIVADGYDFGTRYQDEIKSAGLRLLLLDDYGHAERYGADYVLNQNLSAHSIDYSRREASTRLLLGPRYALLRKEFAPWRSWKREIPSTARKILITLGGSDPKNVTGDILERLIGLAIENIEIIAVVGGSNSHQRDLQILANKYSSAVRLVVDAPNLSELMAWADIAVAAGGTTAWELAFMGLPALILILAQNQRRIAEQMDKAGLARNLGSCEAYSQSQFTQEVKALLDSSKMRAEMSETGRALVDGFGSDRVCFHLRQDKLQFRTVAAGDRELVWRWANDPAARAMSFSPETIAWKDHVAWFDLVLANRNCRFWLALDNQEQTVGQVRFDLNDRDATISVGLDRSWRGKKLGALLIWSAIRKLLEEEDTETIHSYVRPNNSPSIRAFEKAGFERIADTSVKGCTALHFRFKRDNADI